MCVICVKMAVGLVSLLFLVGQSAAKLDRQTYRTLLPFRVCLSKKYPGVCLKERALDALDATMRSEKPFSLFGIVDVERNPTYSFLNNHTHLPEDASERSLKLSDILHDKLEEYFQSRVFKFSMTPSVEEGRRKDKGGGKGGMMMLAMGGMACMAAQMFMGKIAFMAGTALVIAKVAFMMSAIIGLKKLAGGDGGGKESHVVYATEGHSHGGGGWHRSLLNADAQNIAYKAHISDATGY